MFFAREEAYMLRTRAEQEIRDENAWMIGLYVLEAIGSAFSDSKNPHHYPSYPRLVETMDEALAEKRKLQELIAARDSFLAVSKHISGDKQYENKGGVLVAPSDG